MTQENKPVKVPVVNIEVPVSVKDDLKIIGIRNTISLKDLTSLVLRKFVKESTKKPTLAILLKREFEEDDRN